MKKNKKIIFTIAFLIFIVCAVVFVLIMNKNKETQSRKEGLKVVILDSGEYFYSDSGIQYGIDMAMQTIEKENKIPVTMEIVDDGGNYVQGIAMAKKLALDDSVDVVISFQNFESIGPEVPFFEEAKKPFIVTMGCYDDVAENNYHYFLADFLSGKTIGNKIGEFMKENKSKNIVLSHSDTTFEKDEMRGIQSIVKNNEDINICYTQTGPFNRSELSSLLVQCERMNVDTIVANFYDQMDSVWVLSQIRKKAPDITCIGDYALDSSDILSEYGKDLEGVIILPNYPYENSEKFQEFVKQYEEFSKEAFSTKALQYYDLFMMLSESCENKTITGTNIMNSIKDEQGYEGIGGTIFFDERGCLNAEKCPVFECINSEFVIVNETQTSNDD